jgi:hypothetical protein
VVPGGGGGGSGQALGQRRVAGGGARRLIAMRSGSTVAAMQNPLVPVATGSRIGCVSDVSALDMSTFGNGLRTGPPGDGRVPSVFPSTSDFAAAEADRLPVPGVWAPGDRPLAGYLRDD